MEVEGGGGGTKRPKTGFCSGVDKRHKLTKGINEEKSGDRFQI